MAVSVSMPQEKKDDKLGKVLQMAQIGAAAKSLGPGTSPEPAAKTNLAEESAKAPATNDAPAPPSQAPAMGRRYMRKTEYA